MTPEELADFQAAAKAKRDEWTARRREYVAAACGIVPTMQPWPLKRLNVWKIRPPPGTIEEE